MSGKRVLALYAAVLLGFAVVLCRLYFLAENHTYAARAEAQSTVRLSLPARRGSFYDHSGLLLTGLETRYLALCFPGENNYTRLYAFTDSAGQALLYRNRNRSAPFLLEVDRDLSGRGIRCFATARRCAEVPLWKSSARAHAREEEEFFRESRPKSNLPAGRSRGRVRRRA